VPYSADRNVKDQGKGLERTGGGGGPEVVKVSKRKKVSPNNDQCCSPLSLYGGNAGNWGKKEVVSCKGEEKVQRWWLESPQKKKGTTCLSLFKNNYMERKKRQKRGFYKDFKGVASIQGRQINNPYGRGIGIADFKRANSRKIITSINDYPRRNNELVGEK